MTPGEPNWDMSERQAHAEATYDRLFGRRDSGAPDNDPELMESSPVQKCLRHRRPLTIALGN